MTNPIDCISANVWGSILMYADNPRAAFVSKAFSNWNRLAMKYFWMEGTKTLKESQTHIVGTEYFMLRGSVYKEEVRESLKKRMQAIEHSEGGIPNEQRIVHCFKSLLKAQSDAIRATTLQSARDNFNQIQRYHGGSICFDRIMENEILIGQADFKVQLNVLMVWNSIIRGVGRFPQNLELNEIRPFINDAQNNTLFETSGPFFLRWSAAYGFTAMPKEISRFNIAQLELQAPMMIDLPIEFGNFLNLTQLSIKDTQFQQVPLAICRLTTLQELDLSNNQITALPEGLTALVHLTKFVFDDNRLTYIPGWIEALSSLQKLEVNRNQLGYLPFELSALPNLQSLSVAENRLTYIPSWINECHSLTTLDLRGNQIAEFPAFFANLSFERMLTQRELGYSFTLTNNPIRSIRTLAYTLIPPMRINLDQLEEIEVSFTEWFRHFYTIPQISWGDSNQSTISFFLNTISNALIWTINQITLNIVEPLVRLVRGWLGYPATVRL